MTKILLSIGVVVILLIGGISLWRPSSPSSTSAVQGTTDTAVRTIEVEAGAFYFKPAEIRVKQGEKIKLVVRSVDMMHDYNVDALGIKSPIVKSGNTGSVEFTANQIGEFESYCSVGQHRANGQVGKLIVE